MSCRPLTCEIVGINCQKNAVVCEGYPEKVVWKSGRQKAQEGMDKRLTGEVIRHLLIERNEHSASGSGGYTAAGATGLDRRD